MRVGARGELGVPGHSLRCWLDSFSPRSNVQMGQGENPRKKARVLSSKDTKTVLKGQKGRGGNSKVSGRNPEISSSTTTGKSWYPVVLVLVKVSCVSASNWSQNR